MNACVQTGLRGTDRREMASTCYIAGPLLSPKLHDTHTHKSTHLCASVWVFAHVLCPQSRPVHTEVERGMDVLFFSLPLLLSSSIWLLSHTLLSPHLSFNLSLLHYLFRRSLLFSLHLSSSQLAYALSSSSLSLSGCLSASASLALIPLLREETCAPSILSLSLLLMPMLSPSLLSLTLKCQYLFLNHSFVVSIPPFQAPLRGVLAWLTQIPSIFCLVPPSPFLMGWLS